MPRPAWPARRRGGSLSRRRQVPKLRRMLDALAQGAIAFMYRPRVQTDVARGFDDVQAFYVVLAAAGGGVARRLRVGRKRLPEGRGRERFWAYVDRVGRRPEEVVSDLAATEYWTKTRG